MPRNKICSLGNSCPLKNTCSCYILMTLYHRVLFTIITTTHGELDTSNRWWLVLVAVGKGKLFIFLTMENEWGKIRNLHLVILSSLKGQTRSLMCCLPLLYMGECYPMAYDGCVCVHVYACSLAFNMWWMAGVNWAGYFTSMSFKFLHLWNENENAFLIRLL